MTSSRRLIPEVDDPADGDVIDGWTLARQSLVKSDLGPAVNTASIVYYYAPVRVGEVLWRPCLFVCPRASVSPELNVGSLPSFYACYLCRGSVLLLRRCDTLCTSGFMDDVIFAHNGPYAGVSVNTGTASQPDAQPGCGSDSPGGRHPNRTNGAPTPIILPILHRMPFLPQPSQFILAWDRHRFMLAYIPGGLVNIEIT